MKKMISLALGATAVLALSGCNSSGGPSQGYANVKIYHDYYEAINNDTSEVYLNNQSSYDIYEIWSAKQGGSYVLVKPPKTVVSGGHRTFGTHQCNPNSTESWKIKVLDETYHYSKPLTYERQCGYIEHLTVVDND